MVSDDDLLMVGLGGEGDGVGVKWGWLVGVRD